LTNLSVPESPETQQKEGMTQAQVFLVYFSTAENGLVHLFFWVLAMLHSSYAESKRRHDSGSGV